MPAQDEEVVVDADRVQAEDLGEDEGEALLQRGPRSAAHRPCHGARLGQGLAVHLAVRGQRQALQRDQGSGHHVVRKLARGMLAHQVHIRQFTAGHRHDVADQPFAAAVLAEHHGRVADHGRAAQRGLDLTQFDPVPAQLHLVVHAADVVEHPVRVPAGEVAGAVHPLARGVEGGGHEPGGGEAGPVQIAAGKTAADVDLPGHPGRHRAQRGVQQIHPVRRQRPSDRGAFGPVQRAGAGGGEHGLGRAVAVEHPDAVRPARHDLLLARLTGDHHRQVGRQGAALGQRRGDRGRKRQQIDPLLGDQVDQRGSGQPAQLVGQHQRAAAEQRHRPLPDRGVEAGRSELQHPGVRDDVEPCDQVEDHLGEPQVVHHDALGPPGRAGRVDHVRGIGGQQRPGALGVGRIARGAGGHPRRAVRIVDQDHLGPAGGQRAADVHGGHDHGRPGVLEHERDPVGRVLRVDREVGGTCLLRREHRHQEFGGARQHQRDDRVRARTARDQLVRHPVGPRVQFGVVHRAAAPAQCRCVGRGGDPFGEQRRHVAHPAFGEGTRPRADDVGTLVGGERVQRPQRPLRVVHHGGQQSGQPLPDPLGAVRREQVRPVGQLQPEPGARMHQQGHRVLAGELGPDVVHGQARHDRTQLRQVRRIVLDGHGRVKESADPGQPLDVAQAQVLVVGQGQLLVLQAGGDVGERPVGVEPHRYRQGVHEHADHLVHTGQIGRAAGLHAAEHHVPAAGELADEDRPAGVHHGGEREATAAREPGDRIGQVRRQIEEEMLGPHRRDLLAVGRDQRPLGHVRHRRPPRPLRARDVALAQPAQVVLVRPGFGGSGRAVPVGAQQLAQHDGGGPAVRHDVVERPQQPVPVGAEADQREPHGRGSRQVDAAVPVGGREVGELRLGGAAQVDVRPGKLDRLGDDLQLLAGRAVAEAAAQVDVALQQARGGGAQPVLIQRPGQVRVHLDVVDVQFVLVQARVEQHALLQR
ncbi:putative Linear gramicidin synthase subunit C [Streptomyces aurantiacus JA 4570]|uniref:Putative Linear gramicidin synthase subunit C n=1 Tax=Streptomyces aurantiacus JA 4570 TaxID=1286094 RepID=S3ZLZ7_9ACTN|nr:putative Linear gramicidin synthase subunit C [Streptomyces aurantiacus JA 4570]